MCLYYRNGEMIEHLIKSSVFDNEDDESYKYKEFDNALRTLQERSLINVRIDNTNHKWYYLPIWVIDAMRDIPKKYNGDAYVFLKDRLPATYPQNQPNTVQKKITRPTPIVRFVKTISENPLISGIIALLIGTMILKLLHLI